MGWTQSWDIFVLVFKDLFLIRETLGADEVFVSFRELTSSYFLQAHNEQTQNELSVERSTNQKHESNKMTLERQVCDETVTRCGCVCFQTESLVFSFSSDLALLWERASKPNQKGWLEKK